MISPVKIWRRQKNIHKQVGMKGEVISWTVIRTPPPENKRFAPYIVVYVKLESGEIMCRQLVDFEGFVVKVGLKVQLTIRKLKEGTTEDIIPYGLVFKTI